MPLFPPMEYQPDPAEEEWYVSPEGLRSSARQLRLQAQMMLRQAGEMEAKAAAKERPANAPE